MCFLKIVKLDVTKELQWLNNGEAHVRISIYSGKYLLVKFTTNFDYVLVI